MRNRLTAIPLAALLSSALAAAQGSAPSIYVDIGSLGYGAGVPSDTFAAAAPAPGEWNALDLDAVAGPVLVSPPLVDTNGDATGVTLEWDSTPFELLAFSFDNPDTTGDDAALLDDLGYNNSPSRLTFRGLPAGAYDVLTYSIAPDSDAFTTRIDVPGSIDEVQFVGGSFAGGYAAGVTHARHTIAIGEGRPLVIELDVLDGFDSLNGIQVFPSTETTIGTSYCGPAVANSTGSPAELSVYGTDVVAVNDVTLTCASMPSGAFGFFLVSPLQDFVPQPPNSQGNLCLGGPIGRFARPIEVRNANSIGTFSLTLDLMDVPTPFGFVVVQPGDTLNFQAWYRDVAALGPTSNFSQAVSMTFQ